MHSLRPELVLISLALCLTTACAEDAPAVCAADAPVQVLASLDLLGIEWVAPAGGSDLVSVWQRRETEPDPLRPEGVFSVQPCAGDARMVAEEVLSLMPVYEALPLALDDTALVCDDGRFISLDLSGETAPTPALDGLICDLTATTHGVLTWIGADLDTAELWLLPHFPERTGGKRVLPSLAYLVPDSPTDPDLLAYVPFDVEAQQLVDEIRVVDLTSGADRLIAREVAALDGAGGRWIWAPKGPDASMNLYVHGRGESIPLAPYSAEVDEPEAYDKTIRQGWAFNLPRTHVLHLPWPAGANMEAFDLDGRPVSLPVARRPFALTDDGGVLAQGDAPGEVQYARPGDAAPRRLLYPPDVPNDEGTPRGDVIELLWAGQLWEVPLDGSSYRLLGRGVGADFVRIDDAHLLTIYQHTLTTIHIETGVRVEHASGVGELKPGGDGGYYYAVDPEAARLGEGGLWYLPLQAIVRPPKNCPLVQCPRD